MKFTFNPEVLLTGITVVPVVRGCVEATLTTPVCVNTSTDPVTLEITFKSRYESPDVFVDTPVIIPLMSPVNDSVPPVVFGIVSPETG